jgi:hypothetical protein
MVAVRAVHRHDRGASHEGLENVNLQQEKLRERQMHLQREKRKGERDVPFTGDVCSTDGNGRTGAAVMMNGVLERVWVRCECKGEGVSSGSSLNRDRKRGEGKREGVAAGGLP